MKNLYLALPLIAALAAPAFAETADADGAGWQLGDLTISAPFSRATLPNAPVAGGFMTLTNNGAQDDRLIAAESTASGHMEIHEMAVVDHVMTMRELPDGLPIPAGETVELRPGGLHLMFMQLQHPLVEGETVDVTLTFENAGQIDVPLSIGAMNTRNDHSHDHGHDHDHDHDHGDTEAHHGDH